MADGGFLSDALRDVVRDDGGDRGGHRSSSRRHEEPSSRSSGGGRYEDDRRSSRHYEDDRDRDHRSSRDHESYRGRDDRGYDRGDDRRSSHHSSSRGRYDDGPPPSRYDDRPPPRRDDYDRGYGGGRQGGYGGSGGYGDRGGDRRGGGGGKKLGSGETFGDPPQEPTPPGTIPISQRKRPRTAWDIPAPGFENIDAAAARMTGRFNLPGQARSGYASFMSNMQPMGMGLAPSQDLPDLHFGVADPMAAGLAFARQARRLYVGNITLEGNEQNITEFFNGKMREQGFAIDKREGAIDVTAPDPVVSVQVNHDKSYAFVEFRSPEEAQSGMSFDGIVFQNQVLKIRRPKDYIGPDMAPGAHVPGVVSTNVPDSPNKIFIGGLPSYLTEEQVMALLTTFGELRSFNLVKEGMSGSSKGFAFCEYVDPDVTDVACQGLNSMQLGDRYLVVQRAQIGTGGGRMGDPFPGGSAARAAPSILAAASSIDSIQASRAIQMLNMVMPEELLDDTEYADILEDVREECGNYGTVAEVKIPRPLKLENGKMDHRASESVEGLGRVYVMFTDQAGAQKAMAALAGRQFAGRTVIVTYIDESKCL